MKPFLWFAFHSTSPCLVWEGAGCSVDISIYIKLQPEKKKKERQKSRQMRHDELDNDVEHTGETG